MISAVQIALGGMQAAQVRAQQAANQIVGVSPDILSNPPVSIANETESTQTTGPLSLLADLPLFERDNDLISGVVALKQAEFSYKASAKLLAIAHGFEDALLEAVN